MCLLNAALSFRLLAFVCPQLASCSRRPPRKHVTQQNNLARRLGTVAKVAAKFCMHDLGSMQSSKNKFLQHAKANLQTCPGAIYPPNPAKRNARLLKARQLHRAIHLQTNPRSDKSIKELRIILLYMAQRKRQHNLPRAGNGHRNLVVTPRVRRRAPFSPS